MTTEVLFAHVGLKYNHVGLTWTTHKTHDTIGTPKCENAVLGVIEYNVGLIWSMWDSQGLIDSCGTDFDHS